MWKITLDCWHLARKTTILLAYSFIFFEKFFLRFIQVNVQRILKKSSHGISLIPIFQQKFFLEFNQKIIVYISIHGSITHHVKNIPVGNHRKNASEVLITLFRLQKQTSPNNRPSLSTVQTWFLITDFVCNDRYFPVF